MGVIIDLHGKEVLDLSNITFGSFHDSLSSIIDEEKIIISANLQNLLKSIDQDIYGLGCVSGDIAEYLTTKNDVRIFADLVKRALEEEQKSEYPYRGDVYEHILNFYHELLKYAESLEE